MKRITINDIAREAGVSKSTVSRVINQSGPVDPGTEAKVMGLIRQYNYSPSVVARNLSNGDSSSVAVLIPQIENPYYGGILKVLSDELNKQGMTMICFNSDSGTISDDVAFRAIRDLRVKGVIYTPAHDYGRPETLKQLNTSIRAVSAPLVLLDRHIVGSPKAAGVFYNDFDGAYRATTALVEAGHRKIGIINARRQESQITKDREDGYLQALKDKGIRAKEEYCIYGDFSEHNAAEGSARILKLKDRPTAVITCNNITTLGFFTALKSLEMDLHSVVNVGFDCVDALEMLGIQQNYIKRDTRRIGHTAVETLFSRIMLPNKPISDVLLEPEVILRNISLS